MHHRGITLEPTTKKGNTTLTTQPIIGKERKHHVYQLLYESPDPRRRVGEATVATSDHNRPHPPSPHPSTDATPELSGKTETVYSLDVVSYTERRARDLIVWALAVVRTRDREETSSISVAQARNAATEAQREEAISPSHVHVAGKLSATINLRKVRGCTGAVI